MRKLLIFTLTLLWSVVHAAAQNNATLVLWHADGTTTDVELYLRPRIEFTGEKVLITSTVLNMEYAKSDILRFTYKGEGTGISAPRQDSDYSQDGDRLVFHGINATDQVAVYTANGIRIPVRLSATSDGLALPLSALPKGAYILSVNGRTSKFVRP